MLCKILRKMFHKIPEERCFARCYTRFRRKDASQDFSKGIFAKQSYTVSYEVSRILP